MQSGINFLPLLWRSVELDMSAAVPPGFFVGTAIVCSSEHSNNLSETCVDWLVSTPTSVISCGSIRVLIGSEGNRNGAKGDDKFMQNYWITEYAKGTSV